MLGAHTLKGIIKVCDEEGKSTTLMKQIRTRFLGGIFDSFSSTKMIL